MDFFLQDCTYLTHFLKIDSRHKQDLCGVWCVRSLVKLVSEAESAARQGMLEEMLCRLLVKAVEINLGLAESFSALPWISHPTP